MNEKKSDLRFFVNRSWTNRGFELFAFKDNFGYGDHVDEFRPLIVEKVERNSGKMMQPLAIVQPEDLQVIMDELWKIGIRPDCGEGHIGELNATKQHLEDMKKIAFHKLGIEVKK